MTTHDSVDDACGTTRYLASEHKLVWNIKKFQGASEANQHAMQRRQSTALKTCFSLWGASRDVVYYIFSCLSRTDSDDDVVDVTSSSVLDVVEIQKFAVVFDCCKRPFF